MLSIRSTLFVALSGLLTLLSVPLSLSAQPRVQLSPLPEWVTTPLGSTAKPESRKITDGYFLKLYDYQVHVEKQTTFIRVIREIVSESGVQNGSEIWANFLPSYQQLTFHEVSITRGGQRLDKLVRDRFNVVATEQDASSFLYNGNHAAYLILDDVRIGDVITYSYSITGRNPVFSGKFFEDIYLQSTVPIAQLYAAVLVSPERPLAIKEYNGPKKHVKHTEKNLNRLVWEDSMIDAASYESYSPSWYNIFWHVQLSELKDWHAVGEWASRVNPLPTNIPGEVAIKADELLRLAKGDPKQFANAAVRFVQDDIRYTGVEIGEYSHRANPPDRVLRQRYGDCKDKSLLLAAMLRHGGIEAYMALVNTRLADKVKDELPSPYAFNHAVVNFYINEKSYWADATISHQGGDIDRRSFPYYGTALVLKTPESELLPVTSIEDGKMICYETYSLSTDEEGLAMLHVETTYSGHEADAIRTQLAYGSVWDLEKNYLDYYSRLYPEIENTDSLKITDDREANLITLIEEYRIPASLIKHESTQQHQVSFYASMIGDRFPSLTGKRTAPIAVNYPGDIEYKIKVASPYGWNIKRENFFLDRNSYMIGVSTFVNADTLILDYQFMYRHREIPASNNAEFAADIKTITKEHLSYGFTVNLGVHANTSGFSWYALLYAIVLLALLAYIGFKWYHRKTPPKANLETDFIHEHIGGWLILPLIGFMITPIAILIFLITMRFFDPAVWNVFQGTPDNLAFKSIMTFEFTGNIIILGLAVLCTIFMFKRKAILPTMAIGFYLFNFSILLADYLLLGWMNLPMELTASDKQESVSELVRAFIGAAIWVPYFLRSSRVKTTFVR